MRLFILLVLVGCGTDNTTGNPKLAETTLPQPVTLTYSTGAESINALTCEVTTAQVIETTQDLEISIQELAALDAVCDGSTCKITTNYKTKEVVCGTQEIYKGVIRKKELKEFYKPF